MCRSIKNTKHSELIKRLHDLKRLYNHYRLGILLDKEDISLYVCDQYPERSLNSLIAELEDDKFMVNIIQKEIKEVKRQIVIAQNEFRIKI